MVKFRIKFTLTIMLLLIITASGCKDVLKEKVYSSASVNSFYKSRQEAQLALNGVYNTLWSIYKDEIPFFLTDVPGGTLTADPAPNKYDEFNWTTSSRYLSDFWNRSFSGINRANTLLDRLEDSNITEGAKKISGQAKFLRALFYFNLVKLFGGVPLYIHGTKDLSDINRPRSSADSVYTQIIKDLTNASQELNPYSESDHTSGKATSGAASAMLAQVYAQHKKWSKAASAAKKVIDMDVFELVDDYDNVLSPSFNNGKEEIFAVQHTNGGDGSNSLGTHYIWQFGPPVATIKGGKSVVFFNFTKHKPVWWQAGQPFFDQTPDTYRKWHTMRTEMPYYYELGSSDRVQKTVALSAPFIIKYLNINSDGSLITGINIPIIRYSNILLIYAEALNEANEGPTPAAYRAINKVRDRARGVGTSNEQPENIYPPLSGLGQDAFRDSVLVEEARELVGENYRRAQLLRHDRFIKNAQSRGITAAQDYKKLYPIPETELNRNPNMGQNPGY